jgi:N-acetylglutamate synthase-like GNAT family acetyltransferase
MNSEYAIVDVTEETRGDLSALCVPPEKRDNPVFVKGIQTKMEWVKTMLDTHGACAKLAYSDSQLVGMIQYIPVFHEQIIKIQCIFVPDQSYHQKGIGTGLLRALMQDVNTPSPLFADLFPRALLAYAFEVPGWYSQHAFFERRGFIPVKNDADYLYYPLEEGFSYARRKYIPQEEDKGKALIFFDSSCPFCVSFHETLIHSLRDITDIPIRVIDIFEEEEAVKKRGCNPHCAVNTIPIQSFVFDESFPSEVKQALHQ